MLSRSSVYVHRHNVQWPEVRRPGAYSRLQAKVTKVAGSSDGLQATSAGSLASLPSVLKAFHPQIPHPLNGKCDYDLIIQYYVI
jgi:hypothetical protein